MWSIAQKWNEAVELNENKPVVARDHIWASELGKSDLDIWLAMKGEPKSNDFDARSLRKFEAGNLFEWLVELILKRMGVYRESQKWCANDEFGLKVTGKLDHLAGGVVDFEKALHKIEVLGLPEFFTRATKQILDYFKEKYPKGLSEQIIEVKSTSSYGIEKVYFTNKSLSGHDLQAFHYAYCEQLPAQILYICRDDLRMAEIPILPSNQELLEKYSTKITRLSQYESEPEKEPEILFDYELGRFQKNFNVEYSGYLTRNYGHKTPKDYDEAVSPRIEAWNRVLGRIKLGKNMTENNKEKLEDMKNMGFDVDNLIQHIEVQDEDV